MNVWVDRKIAAVISVLYGGGQAFLANVRNGGREGRASHPVKQGEV